MRDNMNVLVMNFSGIYEDEPYLSNFPWISCADIHGINCYCTEESELEIKSRIEKFSSEGIHIIDSGNYHYVTKIWLEKVNQPFDLVYFDFHPDLHEANFGGLLSCGSWVKEVIETNRFLNRVIGIGINPLLIDEIPENLRKRVLFLDCIEKLQKQMEQEQQAVYISIDKDVLSPKVVKTNWDQGTMQLEELEQMLHVVFQYRRAIGVDICGEWENTNCYYENMQNSAINNEANRRLIQLINDLFQLQMEKEV